MMRIQTGISLQLLIIAATIDDGDDCCDDGGGDDDDSEVILSVIQIEYIQYTINFITVRRTVHTVQCMYVCTTLLSISSSLSLSLISSS